jgi:hypothetical protein
LTLGGVAAIVVNLTLKWLETHEIPIDKAMVGAVLGGRCNPVAYRFL